MGGDIGQSEGLSALQVAFNRHWKTTDYSISSRNRALHIQNDASSTSQSSKHPVQPLSCTSHYVDFRFDSFLCTFLTGSFTYACMLVCIFNTCMFVSIFPQAPLVPCFLWVHIKNYYTCMHTDVKLLKGKEQMLAQVGLCTCKVQVYIYACTDIHMHIWRQSRKTMFLCSSCGM